MLFMGFLILITRYEFMSQCDMWYSRYHFKYINPSATGNTCITRKRFNHLWSCINFSIQKNPRHEGMNIKEREWNLVNYHIIKSNRHRLTRLFPSERRYVYGSFRRWYGLVGDWINIGLPHYAQMDHKTYYG